MNGYWIQTNISKLYELCMIIQIINDNKRNK